MPTISELNQLEKEPFVNEVGPVFEHSPWIAERTWEERPFDSIDDLHAELVATVHRASEEEQVELIRAHPDLVGRAAREGTLTPESQREQAGAGLGDLSADEVEQFETYNRAYHERFSFPFVICARENKKERILEAFPERLRNEREDEIQTALAEISKIAWYRLEERVEG